MFTDFLKNLEQDLKKNLPGEKAQIKMAPGIRDYFKPKTESLKAGVLILLYPKNHELHLAFIRRNEYDGPHSGQISFPGGKTEETDMDIIETALRESHEEIGIDPKKINIVGHLSSLFIPVSNFLVFPVIGKCDETPVFIPDPSEVQEVIEIKLKDLLDTNNLKTKEFHYGDISFQAPIYNPNNITIWGATAMILSEFLEIIGDNYSKILE